MEMDKGYQRLPVITGDEMPDYLQNLPKREKHSKKFKNCRAFNTSRTHSTKFCAFLLPCPLLTYCLE